MILAILTVLHSGGQTIFRSLARKIATQPISINRTAKKLSACFSATPRIAQLQVR